MRAKRNLTCLFWMCSQRFATDDGRIPALLAAILPRRSAEHLVAFAFALVRAGRLGRGTLPLYALHGLLLYGVQILRRGGRGQFRPHDRRNDQLTN